MTPAASLLGQVPVIPIAVVHEIAHAVPLARALVAGGLPIVEVTLRTDIALDVIRRMAAEVPEIQIGAGTIITPGQAACAADAGAGFLLSPGSTPRLRSAIRDMGLPVLPGVSTPSEAMALLEEGFTEMKFFPAEAAGGPALLNSLYGPLPQVRFCPTGGVTPANARAYLALPNVGCVGGSWIVPETDLQAEAWSDITARAAEAAAWGSS